MKKYILLLIIPFLSFGQGSGDTNGDGFTNLEDLFDVLENWLQIVNDNDPEAISNLDDQELSYGKANFEQGGVIVATNNRNTHGRICLEIKKIIDKHGIYPL